MYVGFVCVYIIAFFFSTEFNASPAVPVSRCDGWSCIVGVGLRCSKMTAKVIADDEGK